MVFEFRFPDVGEGITEGHIVKWKVKEGDEVKQDQVIVEIETDKAVVEVPSPKAGVILRINAKEGETIKVGDTIVTIGEGGEALPMTTKIKDAVKTALSPETLPAKKGAGAVVGFLEEAEEEIKRPVKAGTKTIKEDSGGVKALPAVRKLAKDLGIDVSRVQGTGPGGRITEDDVKAHIGHQPTAPAVSAPKVTFGRYGRIIEIPLVGVRKVIAENVTKSAFTAPHAVEMEEADVTELVALKEREKKKADDKGVHLTYLPFVIKAVIAALEKHPYVNSSLDDERGIIINKQYYNIGIAVDTPHGLMVPVIKNANTKSILDIAHETEILAEQARTRKINLEDLKGGTFTITNYGSLGGTFGVPIINYPEAAILGVGRIMDKPVVKDGKIVIRKIMPLSLAFDHRIIDGAQAARFITTLITHLEDPDFLLIDMD